MISINEIIGDIVFISFSNYERYKNIGINGPDGHYLLKGYDQMGIWLEHPGLNLTNDKKTSKKSNVQANFLVTWDNINTIMHYPNREGYDFPSEFSRNSIGFSFKDVKKEVS